jgi:shikimate-5-dehydrogenase
MAEIHQHLDSTGRPPKRHFYIFGHNISHSLSPPLHNAGFKELGLPHIYTIHQSENVDQSVEDIINSKMFGGASVTFPHKLQVGRLLHSTSPVAKQVGAVNTIIVRDTAEGRILVGENTDWLGIKACIEEGGISGLGSSSALVIGAGGAARAACYAVQALGMTDICLVNRSRSNAEKMAANFPGAKFHIFETLDELCKAGQTNNSVMVACIPADDLGEEKVPSAMFASVQSGVLVEMAYRPPKTGMMRVADRYPGWKVFRGIDVLEKQAYAQFTLWTDRKAPVSVMRAAMMSAMGGKL